MPNVALVTARAARDLDEDLPPLVAAFAEASAELSVIDWDDASTDWSRFDVAVLRSTWDYTQRLPEFLDWAENTAAKTKLLNPIDVVRWNTDKHYLSQIAEVEVSKDGEVNVRRVVSSTVVSMRGVIRRWETAL